MKNNDSIKKRCMDVAIHEANLSHEEKELYAGALYQACMWGKKIEKEQKPNSLKQLQHKYVTEP